MKELLRLEGIQKWVGEGDGRIDILRHVNLTLSAGEFIAIMGASGSGKSTLLNIIGLLDVPSAGHIFVEGQDASKMSEDQLAQTRAKSIGFIFQSFNLLPYLTARDNVALPMEYTKRTDLLERSDKLLAQVHLEHRLKAYPATLSGGERQRVAIARALSNQPALLLADEPTGALDSRTGVQIMALLQDLHRQGLAVVLVTHDENVARHAQKIMRMRDGRFE